MSRPGVAAALAPDAIVKAAALAPAAIVQAAALRRTRA
jgi:hypothetical protein